MKARFVAALSGVEDRLVADEVSADTITLAALPVALATAAALVAGAHVYAALWLLVAPLSLTRMALNALDGAVARRTGTTHTRGAVLNELTDRAADSLTLAAGYLVPLPPGIVTAALVTSLVVPFVAVAGEAATGTRRHDGPMGKPDRVLVLSLAAFAAIAFGPRALTVGYATIAALGAVTVAIRIARTLDDADRCDRLPVSAAGDRERVDA